MIDVVKRYSKTKKNGSVLTFVVLMTFVLSLVGVSLLGLGLNARMEAVRASVQMSARTAADSGIIQGIHLMNQGLASGMIAKGMELPSAPVTYLPNSRAYYSFEANGDADSGYEIVSLGKNNQAQKTIMTSLKLKGLFEYALFAKTGFELKNGTTISGYNMDGTDWPIQIGTNSLEAGAVNMKNNVTIDGDVIVGPGGDTDIVIDSKLEATINGDTWASSVKWNLPEIVVPEYLMEAPSMGTLMGGKIITDDAKYDAINLQGTNETITIDGTVSLYIIGDTTLGNSCELLILDDGIDKSSLSLYIGGNFMAKNGCIINNQTKDSKSFGIYGLPTCTNIDFLCAGVFYGTIYAPNADVIIHNAVNIHGAIISNSFLQHVYANFYYDGQLRNVDVDDIGVRFVVDRWREK